MNGSSRPAIPRPPNGRAARWLPVLGWMTLIFVLSAQPGLRVSDDAALDSPIRALAHVVTFGILGALLFRALNGTLPMTAAAIAAFIAASLYGVSDEIHQALVPDRTGQLDDVVLDAVGAAMGVGLALLGGRWIRTGPRPRPVRPARRD